MNGITDRRKDEWQRTIDLTLCFTQRSVSSEFKDAALGRLWPLINPLATVIVFTIISGLVFRDSIGPGTNSGIDSFALWIDIGVLCWTFLSSGIIKGVNLLVDNAGLLTKVYFPRQILVYSAVLALVIDFMSELLTPVAIALIVGDPGVLTVVPLLLIITLPIALFSAGLSLILAVATVYFRDISYLWRIFNQVWIYASGVVLSLNVLEDVKKRLYEMGWSLGGRPLPIATLFRLSPAETFLEAFRACLYDFVPPSLPVLLACTAWDIGVFLFGNLFFSRYSTRIVEEL